MNLPATEDYRMGIIGVEPESLRYVVQNKHTDVHEFTAKAFIDCFDVMITFQSAWDDVMNDLPGEIRDNDEAVR